MERKKPKRHDTTLIRLRKAKGLSQMQLAEITGLSLMAVQYIERQGIECSVVRTAKRYCDSLGITIDDAIKGFKVYR